MRISKSFVFAGDAKSIKEKAEKYFSSLGFKKDIESDGRIILKRGGSVLNSWVGYKIRDTKTILTVELEQKDGGVTVSCEYNVDVSRRTPMSGDKETLVAELEGLQGALAKAQPLQVQ
jgi:hypothetical protein